MTTNRIIAAIDAEIARLEQAKKILNGVPSGAPKPVTKAKRNLSPEARARIAAAQKKRWAKARRSRD
jgi:hypothetical protein